MRLGVLLLLAGCDGALGLVPIRPLTDAPPDSVDAPPDAPRPCSHFAKMLSLPLAGPVVLSDLSVSLDEKTGMYFGRPTLASPTPGVYMLTRAGVTDPWSPDTTRGAPQGNLISPRLAGPNDVLAGTPKVSTAGYNLDEFTYSGTAWGAAMQVDFGAGYDALPTGYAATGGVRLVVESQRVNVSGGAMHMLSILRFDGIAWSGQVQTAINAAGNTTAGALSPDGLTMVYAQYPGTSSTGSDLYVTYRSDPTAEFPVGEKIALPGPDGEELEPWLVDNACSHLYFRRDTTVLIATP